MSEGRYWVRYGRTQRRLSILPWSGVGRVVTRKGSAPGSRGITVLRVMVARSSRRVRRLCTGSPSGVVFAAAFARAPVDLPAGATTDLSTGHC